MIKKLCWYCSHFDYQASCQGYSEYTPGTNFSIHCRKNKWYFDTDCSRQEDFAKCLETAEHCVEFKTEQERLVDEIQGYMQNISGWRRSVEQSIGELNQELKKEIAHKDGLIEFFFNRIIMLEKYLGVEVSLIKAKDKKDSNEEIYIKKQ